MARRAKKKNKIDVNVAVVVLVLLSILLMLLIYGKSGNIGEVLSPALGGLMGFIKYIIPIGMLLIAIYMTRNDKEYIIGKLVQYGMFLVCIATILSIFQIGSGTGKNISIDQELNEILDQSYNLGQKDIGGGVIGAVIAVPLIKALGETGAAILTLGVSIILLVFIFGIRPAEMISNFIDELQASKEENKDIKEKKLL